jgi:hypothetical protein
MARMRVVLSGVKAPIQRYGVCAVSARGFPTATQGLTRLLKLDGKAQQSTRG